MLLIISLEHIIAEQLIKTQFPEWAGLTIIPIQPQGWDNRSFRLGQDKLIRLPSAKPYANQVHKEQMWLPKLAQQLSIAIPKPLAQGEPTTEYPYPWSIYQWIEGIPLMKSSPADLPQFAADLARFLSELHQINTTDAPTAGVENFHRGGDLHIYHAETCEAIEQLKGKIDQHAAHTIWQQALASTWTQDPVWVHGDLSPGNMLMQNNRLAAVIDFGQLCIGDPACDLVMAWTYLNEVARQHFMSELNLDAATWDRAKGWALWKTLITFNHPNTTNTVEQQLAESTLSSLGVI